MGPHRGAAYRPSLWRKATLCPVHKAGPANCAASFRLIFIKAQLGLTQRWLNTVRQFIQPRQSGYIRGTEDAHLLLREICAEANCNSARVMDDFQKAFLWACRGDLLCALADGPHVKRLGLFANILHSNRVTIWHSGHNETVILSGIPEGGSLGPFWVPMNCCWTHLRVRSLVEFGPARGPATPRLVATRKNILNSSKPNALLPSSELPGAQPDLEASALQAMNDALEACCHSSRRRPDPSGLQQSGRAALS